MEAMPITRRSLINLFSTDFKPGALRSLLQNGPKCLSWNGRNVDQIPRMRYLKACHHHSCESPLREGAAWRKDMRKLTPEELSLISGSARTTGNTPPIVVTGSPPPIVVTGSPPPIVVTGSPPPIVVTGGGGGGGGGSGSPTPPPPPPPPGCPPPMPSSNWAQNNPTVQSALTTAKADMSGVNRAIDNWDVIANAANAHNIDPAMLAGIGIRETDFRDINQSGGGLGRGVFQIDIGEHPDVTEAEANDINFAANYAANILQQNMAVLAEKFPKFTHEQLLQATAASYNFGTGNISGNPATIDQGTTGNNYGSNVLNLMQGFKDPVTGLTPKAGTSNGGKDGC